LSISKAAFLPSIPLGSKSKAGTSAYYPLDINTFLGGFTSIYLFL